MITSISSLSPLLFNETSYWLKDVRFADQVKLMPLKERCVSFVTYLEVEVEGRS